MREYSTPLTVDVPGAGNLTDDVVRNAREHPDDVLILRPDGAGDHRAEVTARAFRDQVVALAKGLVASGVSPGDRVALLSRTRWEWTLLDYAIWFAGAVTVPLYDTTPSDGVRAVLQDSGARAVVTEGPWLTERVTQARSALPDLVHVWSLEDNAVDVLVRLGMDISDDALEERRTTAGPDDLATIIYTSGTTDSPKGCMLTHGNFLVELAVATDQLGPLFRGEDATTLLFLPLAHVFARVVQVGCIRARVRLVHSADVTTLLADLREVRPTFVLAVPRVFEKIFNTASMNAAADGRGRLFDRAVETAIAWSRARETGRPSVALRARHAALDRMVYARLRESLGGRCRYAVSGGAPLGDRLGHFFAGIGLTVLEGYGLTETTAALTVNTPEAHKVGTVGRPLPGTAVRVADDGELLFRGGQVFAGYWGDESRTAGVLEADGWLHSGDVGEVDDEGFVRIAGRKKEILVTAGGKNVAPAPLEDRVRAHPLVSHCLVVGDGRPFIGALVTLDADAAEEWARQRGKRGGPPALAEDPDLRAEIQGAVDDANRAVSRAEAIRRFTVLPHDWTEDDGLLTPSLKLRRSVVLRSCQEEVAALYG